MFFKEEVNKRLLQGLVSFGRQSLTCTGTAAGIRTAGTADITAAAMRATLAPADPNQEKEEKSPQDHQAHKHPLWKERETQV